MKKFTCTQKVMDQFSRNFMGKMIRNGPGMNWLHFRTDSNPGQMTGPFSRFSNMRNRPFSDIKINMLIQKVVD